MSDDKALRIANALEYASNNLRSVNHQAAAELRRLYAEVERLRAHQAELLSALKAALSALEFFAPEESPRTLAKVRAAIAKAEGQL